MLLRSQAIFQISFEKVLQSRHPDHNFCSIYPELKIPTVYFWHTASRPSRLYIQPAECRPHFHQYVKYWILKNQLGTHTVGPQPKEWNGRESELNFSSSGSQKSVEISWNSARFDISWNVLRLRNTIVIRTRKVGDKGRFPFSQNFRNFRFGGKWNTFRQFVPLENSQKKWKI